MSWRMRWNELANALECAGLADSALGCSIRNDLMHRRHLGLARLDGRGRGARWSLVEVTGE